MRNMLQRRPGFLSSHLKLYVGHDGKALDFVGKQERLADDLVHALRLAGEQFDEQALRATPYSNAGAALETFRNRCHCDEALIRDVCAAEEWILRTFDYTETMPVRAEASMATA